MGVFWVMVFWVLVVGLGVGVLGWILVVRSRKPCGHYSRYWRFGSTNQCLGCENVELLADRDRLRVENAKLVDRVRELGAIVAADDEYLALLHSVGTRSEDVLLRIQKARDRCAALRRAISVSDFQCSLHYWTSERGSGV